MKTLAVEVITPERSVYKDAAEFLLLPSAGGPMAVLPGHAPFIGRLAAGSMRIDNKGSCLHLAVSAGVFEVSPAKVTVIVNAAQIRHSAD